MRSLLVLALFQSASFLFAQTSAPATPPGAPPQPAASQSLLPDSPGTVQPGHPSTTLPPLPPPPCVTLESHSAAIVTTDAPTNAPTGEPLCTPRPNPYQRFLNSSAPLPLTPRQKGLLAVHDVIDPANIFTITANAGLTVGIDPHTGYGPGWAGFGRDVGYSFVQDATGEFFSTFLFDSLFHQDPHYHRSPTATVPRRFLHAISHTVISQHDDGTPMVNYSTLLTYPISAEIANLYVPGVATNAPSTAKRVAIGLASNPIDDIITEFLPDFARRVHIRVVFMQQILNNISSGQPM